MHGATKRLRRQAAQHGVDLRGLDHRQQRRLMRRIIEAKRIWAALTEPCPEPCRPTRSGLIR